MDFNYSDNSQKFIEELNKMSKNTPKIVEKEYRKIGKNACKVIKKEAKSIVGTTGKNSKKSYHNRFKGSKVWKDGDTLNVSAYNSSPHGHLLEYGHKKKNGKGFVEGRYPVKKGANKYVRTQLEKDLNKIIEEVIKKGGF